MNDIKDKVDILFNNITSSDLYKDYQNVTKQLESNKEIMDIISEIKRLQKISANNKDTNIENSIKDLYNKLNSYPLYESYKSIKDSLNDELSIIKDIFEDYFEKLLKL